MVFSDSSGGQGIVEDINFWAGTDSNSFDIKDKTRLVNARMSRVAFLIESADNTWTFDDTNSTDFPIATTAIVSGQADYQLDITHLIITRIEIADSAGNWNDISPIKPEDPNFTRISTDTSTGTPTKYSKTGNSIILYPTPNYNYGISTGQSTGGIRVYFKRDLAYFVTTDTTKVPGFNPQFHQYLSKGAALDYCKKYTLPQVDRLEADCQVLEQAILEFYSARSKDDAPKIKAIKIITR